MNQSIKRLSEVSEITGLPTSSIYRLAASGNFPPPIKLGARSSGWLVSEIDAWLQERIDQRDENLKRMET